MKPIVVIAGPTACGKTDLAIEISKYFTSGIINADSMQVYKEIPILSAQPSTEYQKQVPHYLYSNRNIDEAYSVGIWQEEVVEHINMFHKKDILPIVCGGSGLYLKSLISGLCRIPPIDNSIRQNTRNLFEELGNEAFHKLLTEKDPEIAKILNSSDKQRLIRAYEVIEQTGQSILKWQDSTTLPPFPSNKFIFILVDLPRHQLYERINDRFLSMIEIGALDEARWLYENVNDQNLPGFKVLGGKELIAYLNGNMTFTQAIILAQANTRHYAKRQITWFRHQLGNQPIHYYQKAEDLSLILNLIMDYQDSAISFSLRK